MNFRFLGAVCLVLGAISALPPASAAPMQCPQRVDVRNLMTVTQFDRAGLDKLSKQQLVELNAWLSRYVRGLCKTHSPASPSPSKSAGQAGETTTPTTAQPTQGGDIKGTKSAAASPGSSEVAAFGAPAPKKPQEPGRIESRIIGEFHGWTGNTVFRLENGQVWKQAGPGYFRTDLTNPKVVIKKLLIGYVLLVHGYAKEVFVRRIR